MEFAMPRRHPHFSQQMELPLQPPKLSDDEIRAKWRALCEEYRQIMQRSLLRSSRVEDEQMPN